MPSGRDHFAQLFHGVEACQMGLRQLLRDSPSNPAKRIVELRDEIANLQKKEQTNQCKEAINSLRSELEHVYMDEEIYWRQRCKNLWAQERDRNTRYFHSRATQRRKTNRIMGLEDMMGVWKDKVGEVERIITDYFGGLFQSSNPAPELIDEVWRMWLLW